MESGPLRRWAAGLVPLAALLFAAWLALPPGPAVAGEPEGRALDGRLIPTKRSVEPGERVGMKVRNTGEVTMLFGVGASIERRQGGRWVHFREACPRGCPAIGLIARPGETVGPAGDNVRFPRTTPEGRYRLTKRVTANRSRREVHLRAIVRVRTGRLLLSKRSINPSEWVAMGVRNTSRRRLSFGCGATAERWEEGGWVDAEDRVRLAGCADTLILHILRPGQTLAPRYGRMGDIVRFRRTAPGGLYRLTKRVRRANQPRHRTTELHARLRVRGPGGND